MASRQNPAMGNTRRGRRRKGPGKTRKKYLPPRDGTGTHSVTWMTPELEIVQRDIPEEPPTKKKYEKYKYGSRKLVGGPSSDVESQPSTVASAAELSTPLSETTGVAQNILAIMDWRIQIFWFKAGTPKFIQTYWESRKDRPLRLPPAGSPDSPRQLTVRRWQGRCATRIQALFRGQRLRSNIQARFELERMHTRYRKLQFVHRKQRLVAFVNLRPCKQWRERYGPVHQAFYGEPKKKRRLFRRVVVHKKKDVPGNPDSEEGDGGSSAILPLSSPKNNDGSPPDVFGAGGGSSLLSSNKSSVLSVPGGGYGVGCPVCAALAIQLQYLRRRAELLFEGHRKFTWKDPDAEDETDGNDNLNRPPLRPFRMERLRVQARLAELAETTSNDHLQRFRRDKARHSYAVEAELRSTWLCKKKIADKLITKWREEELILGFAELERQRVVEGRAAENKRLSQQASDGKGKRKKKAVAVRKRRGNKEAKTDLQKSLTSLSGGASIESIALAQLRFENLSETISNLREEALSEDSESFDIARKKKTKKKEEVEEDAPEEEKLENEEEEEEEITVDKKGQVDGKVNEKNNLENEEVVHEFKIEEDEVEPEETVETKDEGDSDDDEESEEDVKEFRAPTVGTRNDNADDNADDNTPSSAEKKEEQPAALTHAATTAAEITAVREARLRKNEDAKVRSLVRRMNLETIVPHPYLRECSARLIQSLTRMRIGLRRAASRRKWRAARMGRLKRLQWIQRDTMWRKGWARLLEEYHDERKHAAKSIQGGWRAHIARGVLYRARRHTAAPVIERWWRGAYVRKFVAPHQRQIRRAEALRRRVYARMSMAGCLFCFQTWHANMISIKLERQHFHLARQIADQKWVRHCAIRIQTAWRHFFYTYVDVPSSGNNGTKPWLHLSSIELGRATLRVRALRARLHPRLTVLVHQLERDGDLERFAIDILGDAELWQNPARELLLAAHPKEGELRGIIPLESLPLDNMRNWIETRLQRNFLWRTQPGDWVNNCRCNTFARNAIHRAGFCRGDVGLPHVMWFPFLHVVNVYYEGVEKMQQQQREVVQALQEKRMMETLSQLLLADTADRASRFGLSHARWQRMGRRGGRRRARMSELSINTDADCHEYIRWFMHGRDTCAKCNALLSWGEGEEEEEEEEEKKEGLSKGNVGIKRIRGLRQKSASKSRKNKNEPRQKANRGICRVCGTKRFQAPTEASTLGAHRNVRLPPLGSRRGLASRRGIEGVGDIQEGISELLQHAAFCVHAPAGHWRRLTPKTDVWEEARVQLAVPTEQLLASFGITTIGSLWISMYTGQLTSLPSVDPRMVDKLERLVCFLEEHMGEEIMAPEENDILNDESQLERDVIAAFGKMGGANFDDRAFIVDEDSMAVPGTFHADGEGEYGPRDQLSGLVSEEFSASGRMLGLPRSWT